MVKKQLIMENALELFAENGIEATSIQQITERCGISKGAFYLSFNSKNELLFGLIDQFLSDFIAEIEQAVNKYKSHEDLLYHFYFITFQTNQKHSDFAKIFIKEQFNSCDIDLLEQLNKFNDFLTSIVFDLVERQFPNIEKNMQADLVFVIKGFMKNYAELFLIYQYPIDLDKLCRSLVEKTTILAENCTISYIPSELLSYAQGNIHIPSIEQLSDLLQQKSVETTDPIIQESLYLLRMNLGQPKYPLTIIEGLLNNLRTDSHYKWTAYLYDLYLKHGDDTKNNSNEN